MKAGPPGARKEDEGVAAAFHVCPDSIHLPQRAQISTTLGFVLSQPTVRPSPNPARTPCHRSARRHYPGASRLEGREVCGQSWAQLRIGKTCTSSSAISLPRPFRAQAAETAPAASRAESRARPGSCHTTSPCSQAPSVLRARARRALDGRAPCCAPAPAPRSSRSIRRAAAPALRPAKRHGVSAGPRSTTPGCLQRPSLPLRERWLPERVCRRGHHHLAEEERVRPASHLDAHALRWCRGEVQQSKPCQPCPTPLGGTAFVSARKTRHPTPHRRCGPAPPMAVRALLGRDMQAHIITSVGAGSSISGGGTALHGDQRVLAASLCMPGAIHEPRLQHRRATGHLEQAVRALRQKSAVGCRCLCGTGRSS